MKAGCASVVVLGLVALGLVATFGMAPRCAAAEAARGASGDSMPVIVTYELSKAQTDARQAARNPKGFWISEIVTRIEDKKPVVKQALKKPVTVEVGFIVDRSGHLVSKQVAHSSGDAAVDNEALAVLDRAAPFPPMPAGVTDDHLAFTVPLRFK